MICGTNPGEHQDLGGAEHPGGHDHLCRSGHLRDQSTFRKLDPGGPALLNDHPGDFHTGRNIQVSRRSMGVKICTRRTVPISAFDRHFETAEAFLPAAVHIISQGITRFLTRG